MRAGSGSSTRSAPLWSWPEPPGAGSRQAIMAQVDAARSKAMLKADAAAASSSEKMGAPLALIGGAFMILMGYPPMGRHPRHLHPQRPVARQPSSLRSRFQVIETLRKKSVSGATARPMP